ncbi:MAG: adenylate/guanylate cyclase domain-containing protein, partial [Actinomycetota bacterium]
METTDPTLALRPYVPRLLIGWMNDEPSVRVREVEGTVVFVDISGFTKMSERLARKGKVGAEEVTDNLGSIFTQMLAVSYAEDGSLLKFGGDALLQFFDGPDHVTRATRAAFGMRALLRQAGRIDTTAGKVILRMSVGVHTGRYHFFLVGGVHREFLVTGPAASRVVDMEGAASAGEILLSTETAALLPPAVLGAPKGPGVLLRSSPAGRHVAVEALPVEATCPDLGRALSPPITQHVLAGGAHPEHRRVTVAFLHFDETDALIQEAGLDAAAGVLEQLVADVQRAADENGVTFLGSDVDHDGGKLILVAGAPRALGDDEERMLLTLREVVAEERRIPVRIGVNHGPVFVGDVGPQYRRTYTVMGDAVNLAARVMAKAKPGQLLATSSVLDASPVAFQTVPLEPFMVKGKKAPVQAFEVGPVAGAKRQDEAGDLPLVGRDQELLTLFAALDDARAGSGRTVELVGDPGLGKTRLLSEVRAAATDFAHLSGACELYERTTAYAPFRALLRGALALEIEDGFELLLEGRLRERVRELTPHLEPWLPLLAIPLDVMLPPTPEVERLGEEFRKPKLEQVVEEFLTALLARPTLIAIEDVHWMDDASRDLLSRLANAAGERPWMIVVTRRDETDGFVVPEGRTFISLALKPLALEAAEELLLTATEDAPLRSFELSTIAERSSGNPLFLREILAGVRAQCSIAELPNSVEAMVTAQIDRLPPRDREMLRYASVLGATFQDDVAEELVASMEGGPGQVLDPQAWDRLSEFLVQEGPGWRRFRHALMRDAAYEGLPFSIRRTLHARAGELLLARSGESPAEEAPRLSFHFLEAGRFDDAWRYARIAADRAWEKFAVVEAAELYGRALEAARRLPALEAGEHAQVQRSLADAYW